MAAQSKDIVSLRLRLGVPTKDGDFIGLTLDHRLTFWFVFLGGAITVAILWVLNRPKPAATAEAVAPPTDIAVARGSITAS